MLGVAAVIFAACRHSRLVPWLFGAFIALKQYLVFALPAAVLLVEWPRDRRRLLTFLTKSALLGAAVTLPFVFWGPAAFWTSVVTLQFHQPFRPDALSLLSWWANRGHDQPPVLISFVAAAAASALALWRLPRTPAGFGAAVGMTLLRLLRVQQAGVLQLLLLRRRRALRRRSLRGTRPEASRSEAAREARCAAWRPRG